MSDALRERASHGFKPALVPGTRSCSDRCVRNAHMTLESACGDARSGSSRELPPGLAKKGKIPPGHMYKMRRHQDIPRDVEWRPGCLPEGYVRVAIGTDVGILHTRTQVVLDVIGDSTTDATDQTHR